jgi:hypothetical protein
VSQLGHELSPSGGDAVLMSAADVMRIDVVRSRCSMVALSRPRLGAAGAGARRRVHATRPQEHRSSTTADALRLPLRRPAEPRDPELRGLMVNHVRSPDAERRHRWSCG